MNEDQISKAARYMCDLTAEVCCIDKEDNWKVCGQDFIDEFRAAVDASGFAAPTVQAPVQTAAEDALDAARWRAFVGSARIAPQGSAGLNNPMPNHYAHMGLEIWTTYDRDYSQKLLEQMDASTALGREWLIKYADVAIRALAGQQVAEKGDAS